MDTTPPLIDALDRVAEQHCVSRGYVVETRSLESDGYRRMTVRVNGGGEAVRVTYNGEIFSLSFPGGYGWTEFAYDDVDREEALMDLLRFLDAYADSGTHEVLVGDDSDGIGRNFASATGQP